MNKIYGNTELLSTLRNMAQNGKSAHTVIFYGEKGSGRKTMASFYAQLLMCENPVGGEPCGVCSSCKNVSRNCHPDIIYPEKSGKLGRYSVDTARDVCLDAYIKPNNSTGRKVYVFTDCENMDSRTQNTLLKIIEEPPDYAYFIFTCEDRSDFLPTIISRCVCFAVSICTEEEAKAALSERCKDKAAIDEALTCFHGNIGMCFEYIYSEELRKIVDLTKRMADSIINRDEYELAGVMYALGSQRSDIRSALSLLDMLMRDAAVLGKDSSAKTVGCYRDGAYRLSDSITGWQAVRIHNAIEKAWSTVEANVSVPLVMTALCAEIMSIV
ncbi:MAG: ATP-binding protein [Ruminococcus sp.]|nr:DNA polymerase III subunit [Oscillospiraceae bacterium]